MRQRKVRDYNEMVKYHRNSRNIVYHESWCSNLQYGDRDTIYTHRYSARRFKNMDNFISARISYKNNYLIFFASMTIFMSMLAFRCAWSEEVSNRGKTLELVSPPEVLTQVELP